jgi:DNA-binding response OmpR family regulator
LTPSRSSRQAKPDILIVDDTLENLQVLTGLLQSRGYKVRPVRSGRLALQAVRSQAPDLVLLDIKMPEMDGFEVCRQLKADSQLAELPVIFLSALSDTTDKVEAFRVGGVDYITKPFQIEEVEARVETHLRLKRLQQELEDQNVHLEDLVQQPRL